MSSHGVSICLLVLLGALMTSGASFLSDDLMKHHGFVANELKLAQAEDIAEPLFSSVIRSINSSCQRRDDGQLMSETLAIYNRIFSSILQKNQQQNQAGTLLDLVPEHERSSVEHALKCLQKKMDTMEKNLRHMNREREEVMAKLKTIEVDDVLVQRKSLAEFKAVYQAASLIFQCGHAH